MDNEKTIGYNQGGQLKIADDVIAIIAGLAISDQEGVYTAEKSANKKNHSKGISIRMEDGEAVCDMDLIVRYGVKIPVFAREVQTKVQDAIQNMTGLVVKEVNLNIVGIKTQQD